VQVLLCLGLGWVESLCRGMVGGKRCGGAICVQIFVVSVLCCSNILCLGSVHLGFVWFCPRCSSLHVALGLGIALWGPLGYAFGVAACIGKLFGKCPRDGQLQLLLWSGLTGACLCRFLLYLGFVCVGFLCVCGLFV